MFKNILFFIVFSVFLSDYISAQLCYNREILDRPNISVISNIAYKLPYRGDNYKFYGTLSFHILGRAFVNNKVYNTFIETQHMTKQNMSDVQIRLLKSSEKNHGYLNPHKPDVCGNRIVFLLPMKRKGKPVKFYYRTGLFRCFYSFKKSGNAKRNSKLCIDFEATAQYLLNSDDAAHFYGMRIKSVIIKRCFIKELYNTSSGEELKKRNIRFVKYLSRKMNRKYEALFLIEFKLE